MLIKVQCERSETFMSGWIVGSTWQSAQIPLLIMQGIIMESCSIRCAVKICLVSCILLFRQPMKS